MPDFGGALATVMSWAIVALVCGGAAYWILSAAFEKELAAWEALALIFGLIAFAGVAIRLSKTGWFFPFLGIIGIIAVVIIYLPPLLSDKKRREMWCDDIIKYRQALDFDPLNVAAYSFLGDAYLKLGDIDQAIENYRKAIELDPKLIEEKQKLAHALQDKATRKGTSMFCPRCLTPRSSKQNVCTTCQRPFSWDETIAFNLQHVPKAQLTKTLLIGASMLLFAILLSSIGRGIISFLVIVALLWFTFNVLRELAKWKR